MIKPIAAAIMDLNFPSFRLPPNVHYSYMLQCEHVLLFSFKLI